MLGDEVTTKDLGDPRLQPANLSPSDFKDFANHPVLIYHGTWTSATTTITAFNDLMNTYLTTISGTPMGNKLANFSYVRAKIRIKVVVQGMPFAAGQIVVAFTPMPGMKNVATLTQVAPVSDMKTNSKIVPHLVIDPSKSQSYEIDLPVSTPVNYYGVNSLLFGSYDMTLWPFNILTSGTAVAASVGICIYMSLVDPQFEGLTMLSNDFVEEKRQGGTLSTFFKGVGKYSPALSVVMPSMGAGIGLFSQVSSTIGDVLSFLGFSKPPVTENTHFVFNRYVDNYSQFDGKSTAIVLGGSQSTSVALDPSMGNGTMDDMILLNLTNRPGLVSQGVVSSASAEGALIYTLPISPTVAFQGIVYTNVTPLCGVAAPFSWWTGDIDVTIEFVASVFHRATVLIAWDPIRAAAGPTLPNALQVLQNTSVYISGNTSVKITIPWKQVVPWAAVNAIGSNTSLALFPNSVCNGEIYIFVINPVTSNGSTDGINFNVYFSSSNIRFALPDPSNLSGNIYGQQAAPASLLSGEFCPVVDIAFGRKSDLSRAELKSFGESYNSVKQLTSKLSTVYTSVGTLNSGVTGNYLHVSIPNLPHPVQTLDSSSWTMNLFGWFSAAYLGYRGGVRTTIHAWQNDLFNTQVLGNHYWARHLISDVPTTQPSAPVFITDYPATMALDYAFTAGAINLSPTLDVVVPMTVPLDFVCVRNTLTTYVDNFDAAIKINYIPLVADTNIYHPALFFMNASADDGQFCWFIGFPALSST